MEINNELLFLHLVRNESATLAYAKVTLTDRQFQDFYDHYENYFKMIIETFDTLYPDVLKEKVI